MVISNTNTDKPFLKRKLHSLGNAHFTCSWSKAQRNSGYNKNKRFSYADGKL